VEERKEMIIDERGEIRKKGDVNREVRGKKKDVNKEVRRKKRDVNRVVRRKK